MFLTTFRNNIDLNVNLRAVGQQQQFISRVLEIEGVSSGNDDIVQQQSTTRKARYEILADFRNFVRSVPMQSATQRGARAVLARDESVAHTMCETAFCININNLQAFASKTPC